MSWVGQVKAGGIVLGEYAISEDGLSGAEDDVGVLGSIELSAGEDLLKASLEVSVQCRLKRSTLEVVESSLSLPERGTGEIVFGSHRSQLDVIQSEGYLCPLL
jgi:hypothetical protein